MNTDIKFAFAQRLKAIAFALIAAQLMYIVTGWLVVHSRVHRDEPSKLVLPGLVIGLLLIAASFLATRKPVTGLAQQGQQFFVGFAIAEVGALLGLVLCFQFGAFPALVILAITTAAAIWLHYARIARRILDSNPRP